MEEKRAYFNKINGIQDDDKNMSEEDKINMNMIRSVDDTEEAVNITSDIENDDDMVNDTNIESERIKREVENLRDLFHSAVKLVRGGNLDNKVRLLELSEFETTPSPSIALYINKIKNINKINQRITKTDNFKNPF